MIFAKIWLVLIGAAIGLTIARGLLFSDDSTILEFAGFLLSATLFVATLWALFRVFG